mmetsp:Transcript_62806/g.168515  ORF Transcript_62806/g.168515 Transcript_62806/m.168515 type:complete len:212 (-) Transcript_62806:1075-1710(-)
MAKLNGPTASAPTPSVTGLSTCTVSQYSMPTASGVTTTPRCSLSRRVSTKTKHSFTWPFSAPPRRYNSRGGHPTFRIVPPACSNPAVPYGGSTISPTSGNSPGNTGWDRAKFESHENTNSISSGLSRRFCISNRNVRALRAPQPAEAHSAWYLRMNESCCPSTSPAATGSSPTTMDSAHWFGHPTCPLLVSGSDMLGSIPSAGGTYVALMA